MIESHPLEPFLPKGARLLMLGSFPPPKKRWCMHFYYPNFGNDMWRIFGKVFFGERDYFVRKAEKSFDREKIIEFLNRVGIGLYDTATKVRRLEGNASDASLEIVQPTDVGELLQKIPDCIAIDVTGTLAAKTLCDGFGKKAPPVGGHVDFLLGTRPMTIFRTPSSSRAYPLAFEKKVEAYRKLFAALKML